MVQNVSLHSESFNLNPFCFFHWYLVKVLQKVEGGITTARNCMWHILLIWVSDSCQNLLLIGNTDNVKNKKAWNCVLFNQHHCSTLVIYIYIISCRLTSLSSLFLCHKSHIIYLFCYIICKRCMWHRQV